MVVDKIAQNDVIISVKIIRVGKEAKKFNAEKVFADYFINKEAAEKLVAEKQKEAKEKALKEFANAASTPSGLKYIVLQEGTGNKPVATSNVKVHYIGMFLDGKVFDSREEIVTLLTSLCNGATAIDKDGDDIDFNELDDGPNDVYFKGGQGLVEFGDDYVTLSIYELFK